MPLIQFTAVKGRMGDHEQVLLELEANGPLRQVGADPGDHGQRTRIINGQDVRHLRARRTKLDPQSRTTVRLMVWQNKQLEYSPADAERAMHHHLVMPKSLWAERFIRATYIRNRTPTKALDGRTGRYEMLSDVMKDLRTGGPSAHRVSSSDRARR